MGDHLREVVQFFQRRGQPSLGTWEPGRRLTAGHWRSLRERAGHDGDVGERQDARTPARARARRQPRRGEGWASGALAPRTSMANPGYNCLV